MKKKRRSAKKTILALIVLVSLLCGAALAINASAANIEGGSTRSGATAISTGSNYIRYPMTGTTSNAYYWYSFTPSSSGSYKIDLVLGSYAYAYLGVNMYSYSYAAAQSVSTVSFDHAPTTTDIKDINGNYCLNMSSGTNSGYSFTVSLTGGTKYLFFAYSKYETDFAYLNITRQASTVSDFANSAVTETTATFTWTAVGNGTVKIQQSPTGQDSWTDCSYVDYAPSSNSKTSTVKNLSANTTYDFRLVVKGGDYAGNSNVVTAKTLAAKVATPQASPSGGSVDSGTLVTLTCSTEGATIYYTTDSSTPTTSSQLYTGPISLTTSAIRAFAVKEDMRDSSVLYAIFTIKPKVETPVISPTAGTYFGSQSVSITCGTAGATIYYTTNGSTPTTSSTKYTGPFQVSTSCTVSAIAARPSYTNSSPASAEYTIIGVTVTPYDGTYDGEAHDAAAVSDTLPGDTVTYSEDGVNYFSTCPQLTDAGTHSVYVRVERSGYSPWESGELTVTIDRAAGDISITGDPTKTYDGSAAANPSVSNNGTGTVTYTYYTDSSGSIGTLLSGAPSDAGTYWVKASKAQDTNYTAAEDTLKFTISPAGITGSVSVPQTAMTGDTVTADVSGVLPTDASLSYQWKLDGSDIPGADGDSYTVTEDDYGKTLTVTVSGTGNYGGTLTSGGILIDEDIAPSGSIIRGTDSWDTLQSSYAFDSYFSDPITVSISSNDEGGSDIASVQYLLTSEKYITAAQLLSVTGWKDYTEELSIQPTDARQLIVYVRLADEAGNVTYLSSDGMTFDLSAPDISSDYTKDASSMTVTVSDGGSGVDNVTYTVDGGSPQTASPDAEGQFTIGSLAEGRYDVVITAADALGNENTLTVHVVSLYTVTFLLFDGDTGDALKTETVEYGLDATAPSDPTRTGFAFKDWDTDFDGVTADITVCATWDIGGVNVTPYDGAYDGEAHDAATVSDTLPGDTVTYSEDGVNYFSTCPQLTDAGTYSVYVRVERSGYSPWESGELIAEISRKALGDITVEDIPAAVYTGDAITPAPEVTHGALTLVLNRDYTATYTDNKEIGLATVTITGIGNYTGTVTKSFAIYARYTSVELQAPQIPAVDVDGLDSLYEDDTIYTAEDRQIEQLGGTVSLDLKVQTLTATSEDREKIEDLASGQTIGLFLDLSLFKTVTPAGQLEGTVTQLSHTGRILSVVIPLPEALRGRDDLAVYRVHDGVASAIPIGVNNAVNGEYCVIGSETITLYVCNFSAYAVGFATPHSSPAVDTGDTGSFIPSAVLAVSAALLTAAAILRRKYQHQPRG